MPERPALEASGVDKLKVAPMGKELNKLRARREARQHFEEINKKRETVIVLHYSCESFYDIKDGRTPRITSIAARNLSSGQTLSFSIHKCAELQHVTQADISSHYDALERRMLDEFFGFLSSRHGHIFVHWNMRDINFGFQAIEHRYRVLKGDPYIVEDSRKFDLPRELVKLYGDSFALNGDRGRMHHLMELNRVTAKDAMTGAEEAEAFEKKEFVRLHQSTLRKVDVIATFFERSFDGSLKTNSTWQESYGIHPVAILEVMKEHWIWSVGVGAVAAIGLFASLKDLFGSLSH